MPEFEFTLVPGLVAGAGGEDNPLTSIHMKTPPVGRFKTELFDRLTGTYTPYRVNALATAYFALRDSGILAKLDGLFLRGRSQADSLLNWVPGRPNASNVGGTFAAGTGFALDGVDDYLDMNAAFDRFTQTSAAVFAHVIEADANTNTPLIGRPGGSDLIRIFPNQTQSSTPIASGRLNGAATLVAEYSASRLGLWGMGRNGGSRELTRAGALLASGTEAATGIPSGLTVGRNTTAYGRYTVSAFGYGSYLTPAEMVTLSAIIEEHHLLI